MMALRVAGPVLAGALAVAYPITVYLGLTRFSPRTVAVVVAAMVACLLVLRLSTRARQDLRIVLPVPVTILSLAALSAWLDNATFVLFTPALINLSLLVSFGATLRKGQVPLIERFARLQHELTDAEATWCRQLTWIWCGFFAANALAVVTLALYAPLSWWALYTGLVAYVLIGVLAAGEFVIRRYRFGRFSRHLHDRLLARILGRTART